MPGRAHCLVEGPTLVAVWSSVRRHASPRHVVGSLAREASVPKERVPPSLRSFCVSVSCSRPGSHHRPHSVSDSSTWRECERGLRLGRTSPRRRAFYSWGGALAGLMVAVVAIAPPAAYVAKSIPMTVEPVVLPTWFRAVAPQLPGHPVVLALPAPFTTTTPGVKWETPDGQRHLLAGGWKQAALTWHALSGQELFNRRVRRARGWGETRCGRGPGTEHHYEGHFRLRLQSERHVIRHRCCPQSPFGVGSHHGCTPRPT